MGRLSKRTPARIARAPRAGTAVLWPKGVEERYGISAVTRWRWEKAGRLPPRDVFVGAIAVGWRPATLETAERGPAAAA
jgi:hypothetical protein